MYLYIYLLTYFTHHRDMECHKWNNCDLVIRVCNKLLHLWPLYPVQGSLRSGPFSWATWAATSRLWPSTYTCSRTDTSLYSQWHSLSSWPPVDICHSSDTFWGHFTDITWTHQTNPSSNGWHLNLLLNLRSFFTMLKLPQHYWGNYSVTHRYNCTSGGPWCLRFSEGNHC